MPGHRIFDLDPLNETAVLVWCQDCRELLGAATVITWGLLAEAHYREQVPDGR